MTLTARQLNDTCPYAHIRDLEVVGEAAYEYAPDRVVMLGAGPGVLALSVLENCIPREFLIIDHDTLKWSAAHLKAANLFFHVILIEADSAEYAKLYLGESDFVIIDADHTYEGVKRDIQAWWPLVASGGLVYFHDYVPLEEDNGVKQAIEELKDDTWEELDQSGWGILYRKIL
jgi:predicted O-methyltransferase YrrM